MEYLSKYTAKVELSSALIPVGLLKINEMCFRLRVKMNSKAING